MKSFFRFLGLFFWGLSVFAYSFASDTSVSSFCGGMASAFFISSMMSSEEK